MQQRTEASCLKFSTVNVCVRSPSFDRVMHVIILSTIHYIYMYTPCVYIIMYASRIAAAGSSGSAPVTRIVNCSSNYC